jgi:hypothetical protein
VAARWLKALTVELLAMAAVFAAIGAWQWATRDVFWNPKVIVSNAYAPFFRVNSVFWDPSIYGRFLVVAIVVALVSRSTAHGLTGSTRALQSSRSGSGSSSHSRSRASSP